MAQSEKYGQQQWEIEYVIDNDPADAFYDSGVVVPAVGDFVILPKDVYGYGKSGMEVTRRDFRPDAHSVTVHLEA